MEDCFKDIHNIGAGYTKATGYCRAKYNSPETSVTTEVKPWRNQESDVNAKNHTSKVIVQTLRKAMEKNPKQDTNTVTLQRKQLHKHSSQQ